MQTKAKKKRLFTVQWKKNSPFEASASDCTDWWRDFSAFQVMFAGCKGRDSRRRVSVDPLYRNQSVHCQTLIRWNCEGLTHRIGRMWSQWLMSDWQQVALRPQVFLKKCRLNSNEWKLRTLVGSGFQMKIYCWKRLENWLSVAGENLIDLKTRCSQQ